MDRVAALNGVRDPALGLQPQVVQPVVFVAAAVGRPWPSGLRRRSRQPLQRVVCLARLKGPGRYAVDGLPDSQQASRPMGAGGRLSADVISRLGEPLPSPIGCTTNAKVRMIEQFLNLR